MNNTLIQYAGYSLANGQILGDPKNLTFTTRCQELGWIGKGTAFDILPIVFFDKNGIECFYQFDNALIEEVPISHPTQTWFTDLQLKWYTLPIISNMRLEIGGISYPTAPFNGWYMLNEIATRNFGDSKRYNLLPQVAAKMQLDKKNPLWKDKALLTLNEAVYHSFQKAGKTLVDHHTACEQFMKFVAMEQKEKRKVTGEWSWLIPPNAPSTTEVFHHEWNNKIVKPNFF